MNKKLKQKLFEKYPKLFRQKNLSPQESNMYFGMECEDGWYSIIDFICDNIKDNEEIEVIQVKEKFGGLRFYIVGGTEKEFNLILNMEEFSYYVCERCGDTKNVDQTTDGWIKTLCKNCREKKE